jgi:hypothetical protein
MAGVAPNADISWWISVIDREDTPNGNQMMFSAARQCHWCGADNTGGVGGYAGERSCPKCGWGGNGEPDVPCMFYKIITPPKRKPK